MPAAALPEDEELRLRTLYGYELLDTVEEQVFDDICHIAASICGTPTSLFSLLDRRRQWCKARVHFSEPEIERDASFCSHAILEGAILVVEDAARDGRFEDNRLVLSAPQVRFYAGVPIEAHNGQRLGALCVLDTHPRRLEPDQERALSALGRQVEAQLELRRLEHERSLLVRFAVHDMRNLLTVMLGSSHEALSNAEKGTVESEELRELAEATEWLHHGVEDLHLLLAEDSDRGLPIRLEEVDVERVVEVLGGLVRRRLADRALRIEPRLRARHVRTDPELLRRILENLVFNAVAVSPVGSTLVIESWAEGDRFVLRVADEGPGIPEADRQAIFQPHHRAVPRARRTGTGLGLPFCQMATRALGGRITYEDPASGAGSVFRVELPR